jgi:hypothetical protein
VYSLTAFLLYINDVIPEDQALDQQSLPKIKMPIGDNYAPLPDWKPRTKRLPGYPHTAVAAGARALCQAWHADRSKRQRFSKQHSGTVSVANRGAQSTFRLHPRLGLADAIGRIGLPDGKLVMRFRACPLACAGRCDAGGCGKKRVGIPLDAGGDRSSVDS